MRRGEVWEAQVGGKRRPVLVLTRSEVIDVRQLDRLAEITTNIRGLSVEVDLDRQGAGLNRQSVVNCDEIHTIEQRVLTGQLGAVEESTMRNVCAAINYALGC